MAKKADQGTYHLFDNEQWQRCLNHFLQSLVDRSGSEGTCRNYWCMLQQFFADPKRKPDTYTRDEVEVFIHSPTTGNRGNGGPPSPGTMNNRRATLRSFYAYASEYTVAFRNGTRPILHTGDPTKGTKSAHEPRPGRRIKPEDFARLMNVIPRDTVKGLRDRALILTYFWTARRRAEIARLKWRDIEQRDNGHRYYHFRGKGKSRQEDCAELPTAAWNAIEAYLTASGRRDDIQPDDAIFVSCEFHGYDRTQSIHQTSVNAILRQYANRAGVSIKQHDLRRLAAQQRFLVNGRDIGGIKDLLRHELLDTTMLYLQEEILPDDPTATLLEGAFGHY